MFDMILMAEVEVKTYQARTGDWCYLIKVSGKVRAGDIGYPSETAALAAGNARQLTDKG